MLTKHELGLLCEQLSHDLRQTWMEMIVYMVRINVRNQDSEAKARTTILQGHKDDQRDNRLMELKINSLNEIVNFKDASIDLLKSTVEARDLQIAELKEVNKTMLTLVRNHAPEVSSDDRKECLTKLQNIQIEISELTKEYQKIESEKLAQAESILKMNLLTKENFFLSHKDVEIQVDEVNVSLTPSSSCSGASSLSRERPDLTLSSLTSMIKSQASFSTL